MKQEKEQTTLRLPAELKEELEHIADEEDETMSRLIIDAAKRIVRRYRFDARGALVV